MVKADSRYAMTANKDGGRKSRHLGPKCEVQRGGEMSIKDTVSNVVARFDQMQRVYPPDYVQRYFRIDEHEMYDIVAALRATIAGRSGDSTEGGK